MIRRYVSPIFIRITIVCLSIAILSASPLVAKEVIVAIGDSITQADTHWTVQGHKNTIQGGWVTRLGNLLEEDFPGEYEVVNRGINGDTARGVLSRLDRDVTLLQPDIVIIAIGTNDIFGNLSAVPNYTPDSYHTVMTWIFKKLQLDLPDTPIFVMGMTTVLRKYAHMRCGDFLPQQKAVQAVFNDYNNILKKLARDYRFFYIDLPAQWPEDVESSWKFYADGIHPNNGGYDLMTNTLYNALQSTVIHPNREDSVLP